MPTYKLVRGTRRRRARGRRRRNVLSIRVHRARGWQPSGAGKFSAPGGYVSDGRPKKRTRRRKKKVARKSNPGRRRARRTRARRSPVRRRRRRASRAIVVVRPVRRRRRRSRASSRPIRRRRRRSAARRRNPGRRRRSRGVVLHRRRRSRRRRNPGMFSMRRRNPGVIDSIKSVFSKNTAQQVISGTVGLSASLWGPKLLGHLVWAPLGRGFGGVATSVVSTVVMSKIVGKISPAAGQAVLFGGLLGSFAGLISAVACGIRKKVLPFESGLLACALPTMPSANPQVNALQAQAAAGNPVAAAALKSLGMADYVTGMAGYGGGNAAGVDRMLAGEQAFRRAVGVQDYAQFGTPASSAGMDSSPESF